MKKIIFMLLSFWVAYGSTAFAACNRANVAGTWSIYFGIGPVARCTLKTHRSGPAIASGSYCYLPGVISSIPLTGSLSLGSNCHVAGNLGINTTELSIDAWISKDRDSISGMVWNPLNSLEGSIFSGVKR